MILFNNNLPIFFVKILNRFVCVSSIKIFNRLFCNIDLFNFIGPIISQRPITTSIDLLLVLIDPFAHLLFKSSPYCITQFLCKTIFDINQNDEKEGSAAFSVNVLLLKIKDVLLGKSFVKNIFEGINVLFMRVVCANLIFSSFTVNLRSNIQSDTMYWMHLAHF